MLFRKLLQILIVGLISCLAASGQINNADSSIIRLADPTVFHHNNIYYLYGTVEGNASEGFLVYVSTDRKSWELSDRNNGYALKKGEAFGTAGFWAPQVFFHSNKFFMAYTANENIAIAQSDSPLGPFRQSDLQPLKAPVKQIDPFVFIDDDGKKYLYHVRLSNGNRIFVAEMNDDLSGIKPETLRECIAAEKGWENTANVEWPVAEGPSILKRNGLYYLIYSANDFRNPDYAVGYATSKSPLGPWTKYTGNSILNREMLQINGPGHGDFFVDGKQLFYVFHTHNNNRKVGKRKTALITARFATSKNSNKKIVFDIKGFEYLQKKN